MDEITYYSDDTVTVTREHLGFDDRVYPVSEVRYAGVGIMPGQRLAGKPRIRFWQLIILVSILAYAIFIPTYFFLSSLSFFSDWSVLIRSVFYMLLVYAPLFWIPELVRGYLIRRGYYKMALTLRLAGGFETVPIPGSHKHATIVAKAINSAIVANRKAKKDTLRLSTGKKETRLEQFRG